MIKSIHTLECAANVGMGTLPCDCGAEQAKEGAPRNMMEDLKVLTDHQRPQAKEAHTPEEGARKIWAEHMSSTMADIGYNSFIRMAAQAIEAERNRLKAAFENVAPELAKAIDENTDLTKRNADLMEALKWYEQEAMAAAKYAGDKESNADALLAIITVMANDSGQRARAALSGEQDK